MVSIPLFEHFSSQFQLIYRFVLFKFYIQIAKNVQRQDQTVKK